MDAWSEADERDDPNAESAYEAMRAYFPAYETARDALMAVPAPDHAALLVKIEITEVSLNDDHAKSTLADARRLLAATRRAA